MLEQLGNALQNFTTRELVVSILDVLLVYYVIYRILLLIKGTKAVQMLVGILLVVVLYFASEREFLGFDTLNWLLDKFIASFVVILVIIFQDDIRRGLSQVGRTGRFTGLTQYEQTQFLEEVVKSASLLSDRSMGALICMERDAALDDWSAEAIRIDSAVTKELLVALFVPDNANPTHDGAVIVQKGRISAAGAFLPLTTNPRVDKTLGTRHRAALGLSESTDAVVVVVSEETGVVSVAFRGELTRRLDGDELRDLLQKLFSENLPEENLIRRGGRGFLQRLRSARHPRVAKKSGDDMPAAPTVAPPSAPTSAPTPTSAPPEG